MAAMSGDTIHLFGEFDLDVARGCLTRSGHPMHLRPQSFDVLKYLAENNGRLISKDKLIDRVWQGRAVTDGSLGKCIEELRVALGPSARQYLRNVRGRGYIFDSGDECAADIERLAGPDRKNGIAPIVEPEEKSKGIEIRRALAAASLLVLTVGALIGYRYLPRSPADSSPITSIAVLPFENESGNPDVEYISDGIHELLINSLARVPRLSIKSRSGVSQYKGKRVEPRRISEELSVQAIVSGRVVQHGADLTLYLSLVDARAGNQLWGEQYHRKLSDLASLQIEVVRDVSEKLRLRLTPTEHEQLTKGGTENAEAYRAYLKGRYFWSKFPAPGYEKGREYFQQAIDLDPTYSLGYAGLSHYYGFASATGIIPPKENWPRSEAALNKAMELDNTLAESYNALAGIQLYFRHDWSAAERSLRRGIELNPNSAEIRHHYGRCLVLFGRDEEALSELNRAVELEPLSLAYSLNLGRHFFFVRQYARAIEQLRKTIELEPNFAAAHEWLGYAYEKENMRREAVVEWSRSLILGGQSKEASEIERSYAAAGFEAAVLTFEEQRLQKLDERVKRGEYVPASGYATAYAHIGDKQKSLVWLNKAVDEPNRFALEFNVNPIFDTVRDNPRFAGLLQRVRMSVAEIHSPRSD